MHKGLLIALMLIVSLSALSQTTYQLNYYSNRNNPLKLDQTTRVINPGTQGTPLTPKGPGGVGEGTICADVYVFDANQEMVECCACVITANGMREFSLLNHLTDNPLTGFPAPDSGVIVIVGDDGLQCDATAPRPVPELMAWQSHVQQPALGEFTMTEEMFKVSPLTMGGPDAQLDFLGRTCSFVQYLGSGKGVCSCGLHAVG